MIAAHNWFRLSLTKDEKKSGPIPSQKEPKLAISAAVLCLMMYATMKQARKGEAEEEDRHSAPQEEERGKKVSQVD